MVRTSDGFAFFVFDAHIEKVECLCKRQFLWKASQHQRSDMKDLPGTRLDPYLARILAKLPPPLRAMADQAIFGAVTPEVELAKQHGTSPACPHCACWHDAIPPEGVAHVGNAPGGSLFAKCTRKHTQEGGSTPSCRQIPLFSQNSPANLNT